jgi:hypothetical protein
VLLSCARELAYPSFNPSGLREASEDPVGVMKTRVVGVAVRVGVDVSVCMHVSR